MVQTCVVLVKDMKGCILCWRKNRQLASLNYSLAEIFIFETTESVRQWERYAQIRLSKPLKSASCRTHLSICRTHLSICRTHLQTCITYLATCITNLSICITHLSTFRALLSTCTTHLLTWRTYVSTCRTHLPNLRRLSLFQSFHGRAHPLRVRNTGALC